MEDIELSIIIPVYNSEDYLLKCIQSVLSQTFTSFELILVNDASTDSSGRICDLLAINDSRIRVIHHTENKGLSISREDGFRISKGKWISFIDNDDYILPTMYERMMENRTNGEIICVRGEDKNSKEIDEAILVYRQVTPLVIDGKQFCDQVYAKKINYGCVGPIWGKIIKRNLIIETLDKMTPYKEKLFWVYFEDVLFVPILFFNAKRIIFIDELYYMHRHIKSNLSSTLIPKEYHYETVLAKKIVLQFFKNNGLLEAYRVYLFDCLLEIQSIWYKVWKNESNNKRKEDFNQFVGEYYAEYYKEITNYKNLSAQLLIEKWSIIIFNKNKVLWGKTVGNIYFNIIRKLLY